MRNLKRVLSLSLASIMLLGMMVIGSSAASDYTDVDYSADNVEAIEVLNAIGVMNGDLDSNGELAGTFRPGDEVKRSEMARIMAFLMDLDYDYYIGANPFDDMVGHWAEKYAAACYANGIISGRTTTAPLIYDPDATVTAVEAASMLMRALGYFQNKAVDYPDGFEISTIRQAGRINLFNKVDAKTNEPMTRNDVAQLVLNTLQSGMVEPSTNNKIDVTVGDAQVSIGSSNYVYTVARDNTVGKAINDTTATAGNSSTGLEGWILDLGEHLYQGELRLNSDAQDVFGRPARVWEFYGQTIGTYYKDELLVEEYKLSVSGKTLYDLLGSSIVEGSNRYDFRIYMDGLDYEANPSIFQLADINRNNNANLAGPGRGVLTQVFVDNSKENVNDRGEVTITMINTYLAVADSDYNATRDRASFDVYYLTKANSNLIRSASFNAATTNGETVNLNVTSEDISIAADVLEDEVYLVTVAEGEIQTLVPAPVIEETAIDAFTISKFVEVDGNKYNFAATTLYDLDTLRYYTGNSATPNLKDARYNVYLDLYDNAIGVKEIDPAKNYVFITGVDTSYSFLAATNYKVNGIFLDGTMEAITVDSKKSTTFTNYINSSTIAGNDAEAIVNTWCTYTVSSAGVYTLTRVDVAPVARTGDADNMGARAQYHDTTATLIDYRNYSLIGDISGDYARVYSDDETVFLTASVKEIQTENNENPDILIDEVDGVAVGIDNVKIDVHNDEDAVLAADNIEGHTNAGHNPTYNDATVAAGNHRHVASGSYVLYDKYGYIIAVVAVGDDGGVGTDFVYVYDGDVEERDLGDEIYQWSRKVLLDGELVTITEVNDEGISDLDDMDAYKWYRVTYKADGTVRKVESFNQSGSATGSPTSVQLDDILSNSSAGLPIAQWAANLSSGTAATANVADIETMINATTGVGRDLLVYHQRITNAKPTVNDNRTLHVFGSGYTGYDGIRFAENVKVWIRQKVNNSWDWDDGVGVSGVKSAIADLKEDNTTGTYMYDIAALIEQGVATTIIIYDRADDYTRPASNDYYTLTLGGLLSNATVGVLAGNVNSATVKSNGKTVAGTNGVYEIYSGTTVTITDLDLLGIDTTVTEISNGAVSAYTLDGTTAEIPAFTMPASDVTLSARETTPEPDPEPPTTRPGKGYVDMADDLKDYVEVDIANGKELLDLIDFRVGGKIPVTITNKLNTLSRTLSKALEDGVTYVIEIGASDTPENGYFNKYYEPFDGEKILIEYEVTAKDFENQYILIGDITPGVVVEVDPSGNATVDETDAEGALAGAEEDNTVDEIVIPATNAKKVTMSGGLLKALNQINEERENEEGAAELSVTVQMDAGDTKFDKAALAAIYDLFDDEDDDADVEIVLEVEELSGAELEAITDGLDEPLPEGTIVFKIELTVYVDGEDMGNPLSEDAVSENNISTTITHTFKGLTPGEQYTVYYIADGSDTPEEVAGSTGVAKADGTLTVTLSHLSAYALEPKAAEVTYETNADVKTFTPGEIEGGETTVKVEANTNKTILGVTADVRSVGVTIVDDEGEEITLPVYGASKVYVKLTGVTQDVVLTIETATVVGEITIDVSGIPNPGQTQTPPTVADGTVTATNSEVEFAWDEGVVGEDDETWGYTLTLTPAEGYVYNASTSVKDDDDAFDVDPDLDTQTITVKGEVATQPLESVGDVTITMPVLNVGDVLADITKQVVDANEKLAVTIKWYIDEEDGTSADDATVEADTIYVAVVTWVAANGYKLSGTETITVTPATVTDGGYEGVAQSGATKAVVTYEIDAAYVVEITGDAEATIGTDLTLTATVTGSEATGSETVTWSVEDVENVFAEFGAAATIDQTGKLTPVATGKVLVTAQVLDEDGNDLATPATLEVTITGDDVVALTGEEYTPWIQGAEGEKGSLEQFVTDVTVNYTMDEGLIEKYLVTHDGTANGDHAYTLENRTKSDLAGIVVVSGPVDRFTVAEMDSKSTWKSDSPKEYENKGDEDVDNFWFNFTGFPNNVPWDEISGLYHFDGDDEDSCVAVTELGFFVLQDKNSGNNNVGEYMTLLVNENGTWKQLIRNAAAGKPGSNANDDQISQGHRGDFLVTVQKLYDSTNAKWWIIDVSGLYTAD